MDTMHYRVIIGSKTVDVFAGAENPDLIWLREQSTATDFQNTFEVPQNDWTAAALGRLVFGKSEWNTVEITNLIKLYSEEISKLGFSVRVQNILFYADIHWLWQLVERDESSLYKLKLSGRKSVNEIKVSLAERGLALGTIIPPSVKAILQNSK